MRKFAGLHLYPDTRILNLNLMDRSADIAIVGAGIVGLAHAYMALRKGLKVVLFEREQFAVGASVRNFGLLWPIGQEPGVELDRAIRSRNHWFTLAKEAGFWASANGSLHVVYHEDEWEVLNQFKELYRDAPYQCDLLTPEQVQQHSPVVRADGLVGGLLSKTEGTVYSRMAIRRIPEYLEDRFGLIRRFGHVVTEVALPKVKTPAEEWHVQKVIICSGADFETLYPEVYQRHGIVKCKLQMMKAMPAKPMRIGPSLCAGLTLRHYAAFRKCATLKQVDERYDSENIDYKKHGVHVLVSQNEEGELIIGDSHHYGLTLEPFDSEHVNDLILNYLYTFLKSNSLQITERWNGTYPKLQGKTHLIDEPEKDVHVVNGLGGAGMTLSFGLAEDIVGAF